MVSSILFSLAAIASLVPAAVVPVVRREGRDAVYWAALAVAVLGPCAWAAAQLVGAWRTGFSAALWLTIAVTVAFFAALALTHRHAWRLTPLLLPYLALLGLVATAWQQAPERPLLGSLGSPWLLLHIVVSIVAYALLTIAAVAGFAVMLEERAMKTKRPIAFIRQLPSIADSDALEVRLLRASAVVLALGLISGMAIEWLDRHQLLRVDHKTVLSWLTFLVIVGLIWLHHRSGIRGRRAARVVLLAYVFLTLAYPGVKFVTDVLLG